LSIRDEEEPNGEVIADRSGQKLENYAGVFHEEMMTHGVKLFSFLHSIRHDDPNYEQKLIDYLKNI